MFQLPLEVLVEILSRLPQKSIARFRSVSTSWLSLIDSYEFLRLRLNGSIRTHTNVSLMLGDHDCLQVIDSFMTVKKSSNGLVCLSDQSKNLLFWNLQTGMSQKIPPSSSERLVTRVEFGFGYDTINDDYKVVEIALTGSDHYYYAHIEVNVYSSKSNSWHKVESVPYGRHIRPKECILVSGALHWAIDVSRHSSRLGHIVAFDLSSEEYRLVTRPECSDTRYPRLQSLGGCLAVTCDDSRESFHIWVMKDYGVEESWTKLVYRRDNLSRGVRYCCAIAYSEDGSQVLVHDSYHYLLGFDLKKNKFKPFLVQGMENFGRLETWLGRADPENLDNDECLRLHPRKTKRFMQLFRKSLGNWKNKILLAVALLGKRKGRRQPETHLLQD